MREICVEEQRNAWVLFFRFIFFFDCVCACVGTLAKAAKCARTHLCRVSCDVCVSEHAYICEMSQDNQ